VTRGSVEQLRLTALKACGPKRQATVSKIMMIISSFQLLMKIKL